MPLALSRLTTLLAALSVTPPLTGPAAVADFYGARLGMRRAVVIAHVRAGADAPCTAEHASDPGVLYLACGTRQLTADFTADDRAWRLIASLDLSGTALGPDRARAAIVARYGPPIAEVAPATLVWLPAGTPAAQAGRCVAATVLAVAAIEQRGGHFATPAPLRPVPSGCMPLRWAMLAQVGEHHGVIMQAADVRLGLAKGRYRSSSSASEAR